MKDDEMNQSEGKTEAIDIHGCIRRLSNFERYLLWSPENNIAAVVRILGDCGRQHQRQAGIFPELCRASRRKGDTHQGHDQDKKQGARILGFPGKASEVEDI
jgi:hypothetical protein